MFFKIVNNIKDFNIVINNDHYSGLVLLLV